MAEIQAQLSSGSLGGLFNARLSDDLEQYAQDYWPAHDSIVEDPPASSVTSNLPVTTVPREIASQHTRSYFDDFYNRVHINPRALRLGNLVSTQVSEVLVWNAWLFPITLEGIEGVQEGVSIDGPQGPLALGALQEISWDVTVTPEGPSTIDTSLTWNFTEVPDARLQITGVRIVAWTLTPDWSDGIRERLAWSTDVMSSDERDEQRRAIRLSPRRSFDVRMYVEDRERALFEVMMRGWGGRIWAMPVWPDIQILRTPVTLGATSISCATEGRDFRAGGLAMLRSESAFVSEVVQVETVESDSLTLLRPTQMAWPAGSRLYPVRTARFEAQPRTRRLSDRATDVRATFILVEPSDWPEAELPTYRGLPVLDARPDEAEDLTGTYERAMRMLDNISGIPFVLDAADAAFAVQAHAWKLNGIAERSAFRSLLYALRGRQVAVWLPTHADDLHLIETLASESVSATIENIGYARFGLGQVGSQDIRIELRNGDVYYRRITNAVAIDGETEQITIDTALGTTVAPEDVARICFMMLARSQSDVTEIHHVTDVEGVATSRKVFVGVRDE